MQTEDLDVVMYVHNLIKYSKNYSKTTGSLWNDYRDEPNSGVNNGINSSIRDSKFLDYEPKFIESVTNPNLIKENVKIVVPFKHLRNFGKTLNIPLINCEISLVLTWSENCLLTSKSTRDAITDTKLYVPVVTLSTEGDNKLLEQLKSGF